MYPWLHLGPFAISSYSVFFLLAYCVGGAVTYFEARRQHRATEEMLLVALGALAGGMLGAKLSMLVFLGPATFIRDLPHLWYSGQAWTGAFIGGYLAVLLVKRWKHITYSTGDVFACALPLAQGIGRIGNLLGGDPFGLRSSLPWAMMTRTGLRQPTALYEAILDIALFYLLWCLRDKLPRAGDLFKLYIVAYCSYRFLLDFTRDETHLILGLTTVQVVYIPAIISFGYQLVQSFRAPRPIPVDLRDPTSASRVA